MMCRVLSILLLLVTGLPMFAFAFGSARASGLPACCRRMGAHHCLEMVDVAPGKLPLVHMTCPAYPRGSAFAQDVAWSMPRVDQTGAVLAVGRSSIGQVEAGFRIASGRARQKRGPPQRKVS